MSFAVRTGADDSFDLHVIGAGTRFEAELAELDQRLDGRLLPWLQAQKFKGERGSAVAFPAPRELGAPVLAVVGTEDRSPAALMAAAGKAGELAWTWRASRMSLDLGALDVTETRAVLEMVAVGNYAWEVHLPEDARRPSLDFLTLVGGTEDEAHRDAAHTAAVTARFQRLARDLVNEPAAIVTPARMAEVARELADIDGVTVEVWDFERCRAEGCVGLVAVGQGSDAPGCMIHVRYRPQNAKDHVALVGKGVTFDSGGLSLKPSAAMQTMRCDMGGAATALAAIGAVATLGLPIAVDAVLPCVENMVNGTSYKLGDILHYRNGVTVEIHNTDAEGRLVLADALINACAEPGVTTVVDMATLTGAVIIAIGPDFTGLFTHDDGLADELDRASERCGEALWRLPLHAPYKRMLKGQWSQIKNVGGRDAGSITAALFLEYFVTEDVRWAHLDVAGVAFQEKASPPYAAGGTGQVVRTLVTWLEQLSR